MNNAAPHSIWCLAGAHTFSDSVSPVLGDVTSLPQTICLQKGNFLYHGFKITWSNRQRSFRKMIFFFFFRYLSFRAFFLSHKAAKNFSHSDTQWEGRVGAEKLSTLHFLKCLFLSKAYLHGTSKLLCTHSVFFSFSRNFVQGSTRVSRALLLLWAISFLSVKCHCIPSSPERQCGVAPQRASNVFLSVLIYSSQKLVHHSRWSVTNGLGFTVTSCQSLGNLP